MYAVENTSDETRQFYEIDPMGGFKTVFLAAGASGTFDIDPLHGRFHRGGLKITPVPAKKPRKARKRKA